MVRFLILLIAILTALHASAQNYRISVFNKAVALRYGKSYFKGIDDTNQPYMYSLYDGAFDNHMKTFRGTVDLEIVFTNLGSCKISTPSTPVYRVEMKATLTNNTNFAMISRQIKVGFPNENKDPGTPIRYPSISSSVAKCGIQADYHQDNYFSTFPMPGGMASCGIYPKGSFLVLQPGESITIRKFEWSFYSTITSRPIYERGEVSFCETDNNSTPSSSKNPISGSGKGNSTPPGQQSQNDDLEISMDTGKEKNGCGYLLYQDNSLKLAFISTVFPYSVLPAEQGRDLETNFERIFYNAINKQTKIDLTYDEFIQKLETNRSKGILSTSFITMERGSGVLLTKEEKQIGRTILTCEEARQSRMEYMAPLKKERYKIVTVTIKPS